MILLLLLVLGLSYGMDLKTAIDKAVSSHPSIRALEEELKGFEGRSITYRSYLNPTVGVEVGNFGTSKDGVSSNPIYRVSYSQPLLIYPIGKLSKEVVRYETEAFKERISQEKNTLRGEVYSAFYSVLYRKELLNIAQENYRISQDLYKFTKKLFELGEITKLELFRVERELDLAKTELELANTDLRNALQRLSFLVGEEVRDVEGSLQDLPPMKEINPENLPQVKQYEYMIRSAKANIDLEKTLAKPQVSVEAIGEKVSQHEYGARVALSATLPLFYKREGEIIQLSAKVRSLESYRSLELKRAKSEYERLLSRYEALKREINNVESFMIPKLREELSLALKSYRLRTITSLELSDTKRRYLQLLRYRADLLMQAHEEYARYLSLGGEL